MKKLFIILLIFTLPTVIILMGFIQSEDDFYYAFDERIRLEKSESKFLVSFDTTIESSNIMDVLDVNKNQVIIDRFDERNFFITLPNAQGRQQLLNQLNADPGVYVLQPVYREPSGLEMGIGEEIVINKKKEASAVELDSLINELSLIFVKSTRIYDLYRVPRGGDALLMANKIQESGLTTFSHPNFVVSAKRFQALPNDSYFQNQFYLHNTGQVFNPAQGSAGTPDADIDAPEAWGVTQGSADLIIAVLDDGLTPNHPDLPNARQLRLPGSNFADGNANDPSPANNLNHGNSCAGIIGATRDNNEGIAGIAPESIIMPVRIFNNNGGGIMPNLVADAIQFAADNGADIISNSWGYLPQNPNEAPSPNLHPVIVTAIQHAVVTGRNNRGCIVIFAAGNTARHTENANGVIAFPANVNIPGFLRLGHQTEMIFRQITALPAILKAPIIK